MVDDCRCVLREVDSVVASSLSAEGLQRRLSVIDVENVLTPLARPAGEDLSSSGRKQSPLCRCILGVPHAASLDEDERHVLGCPGEGVLLAGLAHSNDLHEITPIQTTWRSRNVKPHPLSRPLTLHNAQKVAIINAHRSGFPQLEGFKSEGYAVRLFAQL